MKDGSSQTSDESLDESEDDSSKEDDNDEYELVHATTSANTSSYKPSASNILGRLTSAHIRQFVSPDFKQDPFQFHVPSLKFNSSLKPKIVSSTKKLQEKMREKVELTLIKNILDKNSKMPAETGGTRKPNKEKRKMKKSILDRLRSPTLSFILKTRKEPLDGSEEKCRRSSTILPSVVSPCERFNRRNPHN